MCVCSNVVCELFLIAYTLNARKMVAERQLRFNYSYLNSVLRINLRSMKFHLFLYLLLSVLLSSLSNKCLIQGQDTANGDETKDAEITPPPKQLTCDFGTSQESNTCNFEINNEETHPNVKWKLGYGTTAFWLGGPLKVS